MKFCRDCRHYKACKALIGRQPDDVQCDPVPNYIPHLVQAAFHHSKARIKGLFAGKGAGKTLAGCWHAVWYAIAHPGSTGAVFEPEYSRIATVIKNVFEGKQMFGHSLDHNVMKGYPDSMVYSFRRNPYLLEIGPILHTDGKEYISKIYFGSMHDPEKWEGISCDFIYMDEVRLLGEKMQLAYDVLTSRMRGGDNAQEVSC